MALKAVVESLDEIPEALQGEYVEADGRYVLDVEAVGGFALEDVTKLKGALSRQQAETRRARERLEDFGELSPRDAKRAVARAAELEEIAKKGGNIEDRVKEAIRSREEQLLTKHKTEVDGLNDRVGFMTKKLENALVSSRAAEAIREKKGSVDLLLPHVKKHVRMNEVDGEFVAQVVDDHGDPRISLKSNSTDPMTISELVDEMSRKDTYAPAFAGSGASGGGVPGARSGGKPAGSGQFTLTKEQAADVATYRRTRDAASKVGQVPQILEG